MVPHHNNHDETKREESKGQAEESPTTTNVEMQRPVKESADPRMFAGFVRDKESTKRKTETRKSFSVVENKNKNG